MMMMMMMIYRAADNGKATLLFSLDLRAGTLLPSTLLIIQCSSIAHLVLEVSFGS